MNLNCRACGNEPVEVFYEIDNVPVQSVLNIATHQKARAFPRGRITLGFCYECGFISNVAFDPTLLKYGTGYEATQSYSDTFSEFARKQAENLIDRHDLHGKALLEIGCGNGEFLTLLCDLGANRGVGFDPAYVEGRVRSKIEADVHFVKDYYSETYADHKADFLYCKMTLEHIDMVGDFVGMVRKSIGDGNETTVFFQVPDVVRILRDCAFEDIYYEHCSYFSPGSLAHLFRGRGFEVTGLQTDYAEQYVMIDAIANDNVSHKLLPAENDLVELHTLVESFSKNLNGKIIGWKDKIDRLHAAGRRTVIWGSGSKGVSFLTTIGVMDEIQYAVDINPFRQGTFMAGSGHEIVSPEFLMDFKPDSVIIMNAVYKEEIGRDLAGMGLSPEILTL